MRFLYLFIDIYININLNKKFNLKILAYIRKIVYRNIAKDLKL